MEHKMNMKKIIPAILIGIAGAALLFFVIPKCIGCKNGEKNK